MVLLWLVSVCLLAVPNLPSGHLWIFTALSKVKNYAKVSRMDCTSTKCTGDVCRLPPKIGRQGKVCEADLQYQSTEIAYLPIHLRLCDIFKTSRPYHQASILARIALGTTQKLHGHLPTLEQPATTTPSTTSCSSASSHLATLAHRSPLSSRSAMPQQEATQF